jgi:hypothetical protein
MKWNQALKYRSVTDIGRPIREIVGRREETTRNSVGLKWNWSLLFIRPEWIGVQPNCSFVNQNAPKQVNFGLEVSMHERHI